MTEPLSVRNPKVQQLRRLSGRRSARAEHGRFVIEGPTLLAEALAAGVAVDDVFVAAGADPALTAEAAARGVPVHELADNVIDKVASTVSPQPCVAVARSPVVDVASLPTGGTVVALVDVNDPGNAGTVVRSAEAAGAAAVVLLGDAVDPLNPKVVRASSGSLFRVPVAVAPDVDTGLAALRAGGRRLVGTAAAGGEPYDGGALRRDRGGVVLVLGSESHGLDVAVRGALDATVTIPMAGAVESLNLAMAATLLLFEARR